MLTPTVDISKAAIVLLNHSVIDKSASQGVMLGEARSKLYRVGQTSEPDWFLNKLCWNVCQLECGPINAQRDGRPAYYRWRRLFNGAVWLTPTTTKLANRSQPLLGRSSPYYEDMWRKYRYLTIFFRLLVHASAAKIQPDKVVRWCQNGDLSDGARMAIFASCIFSETRAAHFRHAF